MNAIKTKIFIHYNDMCWHKLDSKVNKWNPQSINWWNNFDMFRQIIDATEEEIINALKIIFHETH